jgi:hypothetical protein
MVPVVVMPCAYPVPDMPQVVPWVAMAPCLAPNFGATYHFIGQEREECLTDQFPKDYLGTSCSMQKPPSQVREHSKLQNPKIEDFAPMQCPPVANHDAKKGRLKIQNKRIEKSSLRCPSRDLDASHQAAVVNSAAQASIVAASVVAKRELQLLRLALGALGKKSVTTGPNVEKVELFDLDIASTSTRTTTVLSETTLGADDEAMSERMFENERHSLPGMQKLQVCEPRIGIDIGDVLTSFHKHTNALREVPGASDAVREIVEIFGVDFVFLVSKVRLGGKMHQMSKRWLEKPNGFLQRTGVLPGNVVFVSSISGIDGKGVAAAQLGLSHFIDNKPEVLRSVFSDKSGNSGELVQRFDGILFHFASGGSGHLKPPVPSRMDPQMQPHYFGVSGWSEILVMLRKGTSASLFTKDEEWMGKQSTFASKCVPNASSNQHAEGECAHRSSIAAMSAVQIRRIVVGIEDSDAFGVVTKLIGNDQGNFKYVTEMSGAKVILNGRGSPHPQPRSLEQEPLTLCIRAKTERSLLEATELVEELLNDIRQEYKEFKQRDM